MRLESIVVATSRLLIEKRRQATAPISTVPTVLALSTPISAPSCLGARCYDSYFIP